jgi:hypothetical protein
VLKSLTESDVMPLTEEFCADCTDFMVGIAKSAFRQSGGVKPEDVRLAGSGTLITVGGVRAILTAAHVLSNLPADHIIGLILPTRLDSKQLRPLLTIDMRTARMISIAKGADHSLGPDLGLLLLADFDWSRFPTGKTFFNLSKRREMMLNNPHEINRSVWGLCGTVDEWGQLPAANDPSSHGTFHSIFMPTTVTGQRDDGEFDYFSVQAADYLKSKLPKSFGGCSGGALWEGVVYERPDGSLEIRDKLLSGVAFYESGWEDGRNTVTCHGRRSIYRNVMDELSRLGQQRLDQE